MKMKQRETHSRLLLATLVPALVGTSVLADAAQALPTTKLAELPKNSVARVKPSSSGSLDITGAKSLLEQASGSAVDLEVRPEAWNWTRPVTVPRVAQGAAPAATPQTAAEPAEPSDEETEVLDEVNVTATRRPARARDIPSVVYTVKKEDFRAQNAQTATDALSLVPGFQAAPALGGVRNAAAVFLRGFDDQRFQVLKDGLPLERSSNGRSDVSRFQVEELERIEVVTGGATLRYGSGAVGGVINLITETPKGPPKLTLQYQGGSYGFNKFVAKYGGGDDTFSYNFVYTGIVAPNRYPFQLTNQANAQFYGPNDFAKNPSCPAQFDPDGNLLNNCANGGFPDGTPLFGFLKPEVGPPVTVSGTADSSNAASDTYSGKLVFKPDPSNRITARVTQQNSSTESNSPGAYYFSPCVGGPSNFPNGTLSFDRSVAVDRSGREVGCGPQRFIINTPSAAFGPPFSYNTSFNGKTVFPTGQAYQGAEPVTGTIDFFQQNNQSQTEAAVQWDYNITPTTSLNSFIYYYRFGSTNTVPTNFIYNSNFGIGTAGPNGDFGIVTRNPAAQPFASGNKFVAETALNWQISPGQTLTFGINFTEDRSYQQKQQGRSFLDRSVARTSIFLIDDISFSDLIKANVGIRYTSSSQFGEVLTPGVGLRVTPLSWLSFRANWNYVFNAPKISDLYVQNGPFLANPNLRPESGVAVDAGVDITPANNLFFRATYFNIYLDGFFGNQLFANPNFNNPNDTTGTSNFAFLQQVQNLATLISTGIEFQGQWQITDQFSLLVNWTNTDSRAVGRTDSISTTLFTYQIQNAGIPFNNVGFRLTYANKGLIAAFVGRYYDGFVIDYNNTRTPTFFTLDFNSEIPITPYFTLLGSVFNIFDTQYQNPAGLPAPGTTFTVGGRLEIGG
ncbi:TonB-dependent receptor [Gloeobacter kilaueensis]|uniref:TonB-dependent receptor n=1 Tax=Gloeobacter kilaueensis (strain ATCC BAA-2537 / CCAP 1431/1 / ULC 316 / JS1) TaxID=1183438 RepID=U5QJT8_GLOK1|nr:TonB-dependent receptor [Gloeobacter kilaueensis]AGY57920.1 TonB-dependent receptor [Gloeobacter kilaueensis JS1]